MKKIKILILGSRPEKIDKKFKFEKIYAANAAIKLTEYLKTDLVQHLINILSLFKAYFQPSFLHYLYNHLRILLDDNFQ